MNRKRFKAVRMAPVILLVAISLARVAVAQEPSMLDSRLDVRKFVSGLTTPTTIAFIGENDILVLEKNTGKVRRVINGVLQPNSVVQVPVNFFSERGLLGIALHPTSNTTALFTCTGPRAAPGPLPEIPPPCCSWATA